MDPPVLISKKAQIKRFSRQHLTHARQISLSTSPTNKSCRYTVFELIIQTLQVSSAFNQIKKYIICFTNYSKFLPDHLIFYQAQAVRHVLWTVMSKQCLKHLLKMMFLIEERIFKHWSRHVEMLNKLWYNAAFVCMTKLVTM